MAMEAERTVVEGARERVQSAAPPNDTHGHQEMVAASGISPGSGGCMPISGSYACCFPFSR
jgi:hypothetical protein